MEVHFHKNKLKKKECYEQIKRTKKRNDSRKIKINLH